MSKYQRWYDQLVDRARSRTIPSCYTEMHHIVPRSLGGHNGPLNLVRLTYREHFVAHWLLTKLKVGGELRKMQRALFAMTMTIAGRPVATGWQYEAAKRAVRDLELDPEAERLFHERWREARRLKAEQIRARFERRQQDRQTAARTTVERLLNAPHLDRSNLERLAISLVMANPVETVQRPKVSPRAPRVVAEPKARKPRWRNRKRRKNSTDTQSALSDGRVMTKRSL